MLARAFVACAAVAMLSVSAEAGKRVMTRDFPVGSLCPIHYGGSPIQLRPDLVFTAARSTATLTFSACDNRSTPDGFGGRNGQLVNVQLDDVAVVRRDVFESHQVANDAPGCYAQIEVQTVFDYDSVAPYTAGLPYRDRFDGCLRPTRRFLCPRWRLLDAEVSEEILDSGFDTPSGKRLILARGTREVEGRYFDDQENFGANWSTFAWGYYYGVSQSPSYSWYTSDPSFVSDSPTALLNPQRPLPGAVLSFWHQIQSEAVWDGGVLEYSVNGGSNWYDILAGDGGSIPANAGRFLSGGYNRVLNPSANPLGGRSAWSRFDAGFSEVRVDLGDFAGQSLLLRWRFGSDGSVAGNGWWIDDVEIEPVLVEVGGDQCSIASVQVLGLTPGLDYVVDFRWSVDGFDQDQGVLSVFIEP